MLLEFTRVLLGLAIALFHAQLADFLRKQDRALGAAFRERGVQIPGACRNKRPITCFSVFGVLIALLQPRRASG